MARVKGSAKRTVRGDMGAGTGGKGVREDARKGQGARVERSGAKACNREEGPNSCLG